MSNIKSLAEELIQLTNKSHKLDEAIHIPMNELPKRLDELNAETDYVIMCRTGVRSAQICEFLSNQNFRSVSNLTGGINEWAKRVDTSLAVY